MYAKLLTASLQLLAAFCAVAIPAAVAAAAAIVAYRWIVGAAGCA